MRLHLPHDPVKEFTIPLTAVGSRDDFRKQMSAQGVGVLKMDDLMSYTMQWVNELQAVAKADEARRQFGWVGEDCASFVLGDREYFADREGANPPSDYYDRAHKLLQAKGVVRRLERYYVLLCSARF